MVDDDADCTQDAFGIQSQTKVFSHNIEVSDELESLDLVLRRNDEVFLFQGTVTETAQGANTPT